MINNSNNNNTESMPFSPIVLGNKNNDFKAFADIMRTRESEKNKVDKQLDQRNISYEMLKKNFASRGGAESS